MNVGTGSLDRTVFGDVVDCFITELGSQRANGRPLDVRENVVLKGREFARHVHGRSPGTGCVPALEFKKTFMDEWTGVLDRDHLQELRAALAATIDLPGQPARPRVPVSGRGALLRVGPGFRS